MEENYKPILVFTYGVKGATFETVDNLKIEKNKELSFLKERYDIIILFDSKKNLYDEKVEMINPQSKIHFQTVDNQSIKN